MSLFSFRKPSFKNLYIEMAMLFKLIRTIINSYIGNDPLPEYQSVLLMFIGECLAGFFEVIVQYRQKAYTKKNQNKITKIEFFPVFLILLFTVSDCFFSINYFYTIFNENDDFPFITIIFEFFYTTLIYNYWIQKSLKKHSYVGFGLIIFGIIIQMNWNNLNSFWFFLYYQPQSIVFAFFDILLKWIMDLKFYSPYMVTFISGCFGFVISFSLYITSFYGNVSWIDELLNNKNKNKLFYQFFTNPGGFIKCLVYILTSCGYNIFSNYLTKVFSPSHRVISDSASIILYEIINGFVKKNDTSVQTYIINLFGYIITVIGMMIYFEIIVLNFYGLNSNTDDEINKRGINEKIEIEKIPLSSLLNEPEQNGSFSF